MQQYRSSGSEERKGTSVGGSLTVVRMIRQLESNDRRSQSLRLTEQSAEHRNATRFPRGPLH